MKATLETNCRMDVLEARRHVAGMEMEAGGVQINKIASGTDTSVPLD